MILIVIDSVSNCYLTVMWLALSQSKEYVTKNIYNQVTKHITKNMLSENVSVTKGWQWCRQPGQGHRGLQRQEAT